MADIIALTDALLEGARSANPDLDLVALLLRRRELALEKLPPGEPAEREERLSVLQRVQLADAEIRAIFIQRQAEVGNELGLLMMRPRDRALRQQSTALVARLV